MAALGGCSTVAVQMGSGEPGVVAPAHSEPEDPNLIPLEEIRLFDFAGIHFQPEIVVLNSPEELAAVVDDPARLSIDFDAETAVWVGWFLPDTCTKRELAWVSRARSEGAIEIAYRTERDPKQVCPAFVLPFEQLLVLGKSGSSAVLIVDDDPVASWPVE